MIVGNPIIMILKAILNWFRLRRDYIANAVDKIPPEIKDALIAWYSPVKQKLSNFDVIESYITDFTTWRTADKNYVGLTIRSSSFSISFNKVSNHVIMWKSNYLFNEEGQVKLQVSGITDNISIIIKHGTQEFPIVNGVNTFSFTQEENKSLSFICKNVFQDTNITIAQLPTSILKDFSGNGNHAYLYGGKGKLNSGMGVYQEDFSINTWNKTSFVFDYSHDYIKAKFKTINAGYRNVTVSNSNVSLNSMKIKVIIKGNSKDNRIMYSYADENGTQKVYYINNGETGIVPKSIATKTNDFLVGFRYSENNGDDCEITITQIPDYPDKLCYDGKMYAVAYDMPILTDYTVMAERTWFEIGDNSCFASKRIGANKGAFAIEYRKLYAENFGSYNAITFVANKKEIIVQSKEKYNDKDLIAGNEIDTNQLLIGGISLNNNILNEPYIGCHGDILLFNRTLTDDELDLVKKHFFGIVRIKDALLTVDSKPIITTDNKYIKLNKK